MIPRFCLIACLLLPFIQPLAAEETPWLEPGRGTPHFLAKVEKSEPVHVAFLGGSITQNARGHSSLVAGWLEETYPEAEFAFTNAGLSSTGSVTGAFRLAPDVLRGKPVDLLVVEFAVNDDQDAAETFALAVRGLEGIVRQVRRSNPTCDIISVQFVNPSILEKHLAGEEATSVRAHKSVARHYGIPCVDVGLALADAIRSGAMTWDDYGGTHPNAEGYRFASDRIIEVFRQSPREIPEPQTISPLHPLNFENPLRIDSQEASWLGGWDFAPIDRDLLPVGTIRPDYLDSPALRGDEPGEMLYVDFTGATLTAFVLAGPDAGMLEVSIDAGPWRSIDLYHHFSEKLNYPRTVILADGLIDSRHQAAIRIAGERHPKSSGHAATILYFGSN